MKRGFEERDYKSSKKGGSIDFISIYSHQLQTPLIVIKGFLESILTGERGPVTENQKEYLEEALVNTENLLQTTKDLLDVSKIEENRFEITSGEVQLEEKVKEVVNELKFFAEASNSKIIFENEGEKFRPVTADTSLIKEVIYNLISNAVKYNKKGGGEVRVKLIDKGKNIRFIVEDNGIGISEDEKDMIFSKFFRGKKAIEKESRGSGLGLFIGRAIIKGSGGDIGFKSKEGKGATFWFELPYAN